MKDRIKAQTNICSFDTFPYQIELANMKNTEWFQVLQECNEKACSAVSRFVHVLQLYSLYKTAKMRSMFTNKTANN